MAIGRTNAGGSGAGGTLSVTGVAGSTVTVSNGDKSYTRTLDSDGKATFKGLASGTWTVTMTDGTETATETATVGTEIAMSYTAIYGISRNITATSTLWARTDNAVGKTATASVGTVAGASDFDDCYPWSGITRETLSTGDVMVKIPKFWYRRYRSGNTEYIKIANKAVANFTLHPAFLRAGVTYDYIYVGAYKTGANHVSKSGLAPTLDTQLETFRSGARAKGVGWGVIDISTVSAIQMLILVEFADNNVQNAIGAGATSRSGAPKAGTCDAVPNLTGRPAGTASAVAVVWRGIEGFWGTAWEFIDGLNWNNGIYYVCNDPSLYNNDTEDNYTVLASEPATDWADSYITDISLNPSDPWAMLPIYAGSGSDSTYYADGAYSYENWRNVARGGTYYSETIAGLFALNARIGSWEGPYDTGSRLMLLPASNN